MNQPRPIDTQRAPRLATRRPPPWTAALLVVAVAAAWAPRAARACGGCFSPVLPAAPGTPGAGQAVLQDAERVIFHHDPKTGRTLVWVEVRYTGAAEDFGWVLPLPKQPTVTVGSTVALDRIDAATSARYLLTYQGTENCRDPAAGCEPPKPPEWQSGGGPGGFADASMADDSGAHTDLSPPAVTVLDQGQTGPYDYVVIKGKDGAQLQGWLDTRGYKTPTTAVPILQSHADKGDVFVAIKLQNGKGVNLIRPVVLEMQDGDPCVPLRLTSIASAEELQVVVTLAGPGRAVPMNHLGVEINPVLINWMQSANNYQQLMAAAIDEAGGRAFVTESATPGGSLASSGTSSGSGLWSDAELTTSKIAAATNLHELAIALFQSGNVWLHADAAEVFAKAGIVEPIFQVFGTKDPVGVLGQLWVCGATWSAPPSRSRGGQGGCRLAGQPFGSQVMLPAEAKAIAIDGAATAKALEDDVAGPIKRLFAGMRGAPMVTRLAMRIGPLEMDRDPIFGFHPTLPPVPRDRHATYRAVCTKGWEPSDATRLEVKGYGSWLLAGNSGNSLAKDPRMAGAPIAARVEVLDESGPPLPVAKGQLGLVDAAIAGALPGAPSPARKLALDPAKVWAPPASDPPVTHVGPWKMPSCVSNGWGCQACKPRPGWVDGQMPPSGQIPKPYEPKADPDAGSYDMVSSGDASGGSSATGAKEVGDGGCTAAPYAASRGPGPWLAWLALAALLALRWRPASHRTTRG